MKGKLARFLPPGPVLILTLLGLLLLSAVLYYRAVKIQRFLEPALAISQPRVRFAEHIGGLLTKEFGSADVRGVVFATDVIYVDEAMLFVGAHNLEMSPIIMHLSKVFLAALKDPETKPYISRIMVGTRLPLSPDPESNNHRRGIIQARADLLLNSLYRAEPELEKAYASYFSSTVVPVEVSETEATWVEFRIIPTELMHIELLRKLEKYAF